MKSFTKLYKAFTLHDGEKSVMIYKVQKDGTSRTFFSIENSEGQKLSRTMFARLYDAKKLANKII